MLVLTSLILFFYYTKHACMKNMLRPGEFLYPNQSLVSNNRAFELGFIETDKKNYYVGIWLITDEPNNQPRELPLLPSNMQDVVWVANRENPIHEYRGYKLSLSSNGNLILIQFRSFIWSSKTLNIRANSTTLVLLDNGNLVLQDISNSSNVLWQSFDHPTDTWLTGASLGFNNINGQNAYFSLISSKTSSDPSPGIYSFEVEQLNGTWGFVVTQMQEKTLQFRTLPTWLHIKQHNNLITFRDPKGPLSYIRVNSDGYVLVYLSNSSDDYWLTTGSSCLLYGIGGYCGPFGMCFSGGPNYSCKCPPGFQATSPEAFATNNFSAGCTRKFPLKCNNNSVVSNNTFILMDNMYRLPDNPRHLGVKSKADCERACISNCSCTAFASGAECSLWYGDLLNGIIHDDGLTGQFLYVRLAAPASRSNTKYVTLIGGVLVIFLLFCLIIFWIFRRKLLRKKRVNFDDYIRSYSYEQIKKATKGFSTKLGEGGCGSVFKGRLFNCKEIAVKELKIVGHEEKQFRAEVQTIGVIQHSNLVRLLGFCAEGARRLLVYEYMPKGSLSSHLFSTSSSVFSWKSRYEIVLGAARGLACLHEECRDCIIHLDIKPENVLLDEKLSPKIADFGLAKLLGREFSRVLTTARGTVGYLAPEWMSGQAITKKADVYSFGMMLFEVISGKRNAAGLKNRNYPYFPLYAAVKINEGDVLCLLDERLGGNANVSELIRVCQVACWYIQECETQRPCMGKVVLMLEGFVNAGIPPVPNSLLNLVGADDSYEISTQY